MWLLDGIPAIYFDETFGEQTLIDCARECIDLFAPNIILGISDEISSTGDIERVEHALKDCAGDLWHAVCDNRSKQAGVAEADEPIAEPVLSPDLGGNDVQCANCGRTVLAYRTARIGNAFFCQMAPCWKAMREARAKVEPVDPVQELAKPKLNVCCYCSGGSRVCEQWNGHWYCDKRDCQVELKCRQSCAVADGPLDAYADKSVEEIGWPQCANCGTTSRQGVWWNGLRFCYQSDCQVALRDMRLAGPDSQPIDAVEELRESEAVEPDVKCCHCGCQFPSSGASWRGVAGRPLFYCTDPPCQFELQQSQREDAQQPDGIPAGVTALIVEACHYIYMLDLSAIDDANAHPFRNGGFGNVADVLRCRDGVRLSFLCGRLGSLATAKGV